MSDQKKKSLGRGRGKVIPKAEGPWLRSKKVEEAINTSKQQEDAVSSSKPIKKTEFNLAASSFPPLPGSSGTEGDDCKLKTDVNEQSKEESSNLNFNLNTKSVSNKEKEDLVDKLLSLQIDQEDSLPTSPTFGIDSELTTRVSNLSPFAKEFVPKAHLMNPTAQAFVPSASYSNMNNQAGLLEVNNLDADESYEVLESQVHDTVNFCYVKINESPACYDEVMEVLKPYFEKLLSYPEFSEKLVEVIYSYVQEDTKFSYHAVRTLTYLDKISFKVNREHLFRNDTLNLAKRKAIEMKELLMTRGVNSIKVFPFLLFLSELFIHLEVGSKRLVFLGTAIVEILQLMLDTETLPIKDRLSMAVNIIKLTGTFLDEEPQGKLNSVMEDISRKLTEERPNLDENTITMCEHLIRLRSENWGFGENKNLNNTENTQSKNENLEDGILLENGQEVPGDDMQYYNITDNAVFYGPDGNVMPYEEQMFLELSSTYMYEEDGSELSPGSMDGDMQSAYEEFLLTIPESNKKN